MIPYSVYIAPSILVNHPPPLCLVRPNLARCNTIYPGTSLYCGAGIHLAGGMENQKTSFRATAYLYASACCCCCCGCVIADVFEDTIEE